MENMSNLDGKQSKETHLVSLFIDKSECCALILLEFNIFCKKYEAKSKTNPSLTTYIEYKIMILVRVDFIVLLS